MKLFCYCLILGTFVLSCNQEEYYSDKMIRQRQQNMKKTNAQTEDGSNSIKSDEESTSPETKKSTITTNGKSLTVLFWNVENLFDAKNDPGWFDDNMSATDNPEYYNLKIKQLQEILIPFARQKAVMCFSEIENRAVLEKLLSGLPNQKEYTIVYHHNTFTRVKVAMLSPIKVLHSEALDFAKGQRPILKATLRWLDNDLTIFVNHWKSRRGGSEKTEAKRIKAARFLYSEFEKIRKKDKSAEVLLVGDFNDEPSDTSIKKVMHASPVKNRIKKHKEQLYNCLADSKIVSGKYSGSISHKGEWYLFDQMLASSGLLDSKGLFIESCRIHDDDGKLIYSNHPNRFGGDDIPDDKRGYSDHLPVVLKIGQHE